MTISEERLEMVQKCENHENTKEMHFTTKVVNFEAKYLEIVKLIFFLIENLPRQGLKVLNATYLARFAQTSFFENKKIRCEMLPRAFSAQNNTPYIFYSAFGTRFRPKNMRF